MSHRTNVLNMTFCHKKRLGYTKTNHWIVKYVNKILHVKRTTDWRTISINDVYGCSGIDEWDTL